MDLPKHVELIEVCPRDGFQNVHDIIPFEGKVAIIKKLAEAGFKRLEVGSLVLDADELSATVDGEEIPLTVREFNLLYKLLSYPKKTFTRSQLMEEFWDGDTTSGPRTVDVYITKLRSKFARCEDFEIVTVHGLGYKAVLK